MLRPERARRLLAAIRVANGAVALLAPARLAERLGADPAESPALLYAFRMFGVRTIVMGRELFRGEPHAVRAAPLVHASDTVAATLAAASGKLPRKAAVTIVGVSALNTVLAVAARRGSR